MMARDHLDGDTRLEIALSAAISRHQYDQDPAALIAELRAISVSRIDLLAEAAGTWAGYHEADPFVQPVVRALLEVPGAYRWVQAGRDRNRG